MNIVEGNLQYSIDLANNIEKKEISQIPLPPDAEQKKKRVLKLFELRGAQIEELDVPIFYY